MHRWLFLAACSVTCAPNPGVAEWTLTVETPTCMTTALDEAFTFYARTSDGAAIVVELTNSLGERFVITRAEQPALVLMQYEIPASLMSGGENEVSVRGHLAGSAGNTVRFTVLATEAVAGATRDDNDGDCFSPAQGDCNDNASAIRPLTDELCSDGVDNDCDGRIDEADPRCPCPDRDGDGSFAARCGGGDCDDGDDRSHPGAVEICDGEDNDCDGMLDESFDQDGDSFVSCANALWRTNGLPCPSSVASCTDCADDDAGIQPGAGCPEP